MTSKEAVFVFRRFRRGKDGKVYDAHAYGLKAWPIRVSSKKTK
jgi:hypothetical protein